MPSQLTLILGVFEWTVEQDPESGQKVAECPVLSLLAWGGTSDKLLACIQRVTNMLLEHLVEAGQLESFMQKRGYPVMVIPIPEGAPSSLPEPGWVVPGMPVLGPTTRIIDASIIHA